MRQHHSHGLRDSYRVVQDSAFSDLDCGFVVLLGFPARLANNGFPGPTGVSRPAPALISCGISSFRLRDQPGTTLADSRECEISSLICVIFQSAVSNFSGGRIYSADFRCLGSTCLYPEGTSKRAGSSGAFSSTVTTDSLEWAEVALVPSENLVVIGNVCVSFTGNPVSRAPISTNSGLSIGICLPPTPKLE